MSPFVNDKLEPWTLTRFDVQCFDSEKNNEGQTLDKLNKRRISWIYRNV